MKAKLVEHNIISNDYRPRLLADLFLPNYLLEIPWEILVKIISYLPYWFMQNCFRVNKYFAKLPHYAPLWYTALKRLLRVDFMFTEPIDEIDGSGRGYKPENVHAYTVFRSIPNALESTFCHFDHLPLPYASRHYDYKAIIESVQWRKYDLFVALIKKYGVDEFFTVREELELIDGEDILRYSITSAIDGEALYHLLDDIMNLPAWDCYKYLHALYDIAPVDLSQSLCDNILSYKFDENPRNYRSVNGIATADTTDACTAFILDILQKHLNSDVKLELNDALWEKLLNHIYSPELMETATAMANLSASKLADIYRNTLKRECVKAVVNLDYVKYVLAKLDPTHSMNVTGVNWLKLINSQIMPDLFDVLETYHDYDGLELFNYAARFSSRSVYIHILQKLHARGFRAEKSDYFDILRDGNSILVLDEVLSVLPENQLPPVPPHNRTPRGKLFGLYLHWRRGSDKYVLKCIANGAGLQDSLLRKYAKDVTMVYTLIEYGLKPPRREVLMTACKYDRPDLLSYIFASSKCRPKIKNLPIIIKYGSYRVLERLLASTSTGNAAFNAKDTRGLPPTRALDAKMVMTDYFHAIDTLSLIIKREEWLSKTRKERRNENICYFSRIEMYFVQEKYLAALDVSHAYLNDLLLVACVLHDNDIISSTDIDSIIHRFASINSNFANIATAQFSLLKLEK